MRDTPVLESAWWREEMARRRKSRKAPRTGTQATPLKKLSRFGNVLSSPMRQLGNLQFSSWINDVLPDSLWSVLIAGLLPRDKTISAFRLILTLYKRNHEILTPTMLVHSQLAKFEPAKFDLLFGGICSDKESREALSPLLIIESLPDAVHWKRILGEPPESSDALRKLARAVAASFDHQSQEATDCRWLKVMTVMAQGKMLFAEEMREKAEEIIHYPDRGDMRKVRPSIRAAEMSLRGPATTKDVPAVWSEEFWAECFRRTGCVPSHLDEEATTSSYADFFEQIVKVYDQLTEHFLQTIKTAKIDARHDGSFGLTFYNLQMLIFTLKAAVGQTVASRIILRTALEAYVTLRFLAEKDDESIWMQYRNYGYGQSKLAYLKNLSVSDIPSFITLELLEHLANEDMWLEFQDIKLGAWSDKNLRNMATEAGVKEIYDRYYDTLSGYVHGNWVAVRHSVFGTCLNPLHRFHRIPMPPRLLTDDTVPDLVKLVNLTLHELTKMYPPFKPRLKFKVEGVDKKKAQAKDETTSEKTSPDKVVYGKDE